VNIVLNEKERVCHEVHHHSIETIIFCRREPYTVLFRERGWMGPRARTFRWFMLQTDDGEPLALWGKLCSRLRCTVNYGSTEQPQFVVLFGHHSHEEVSEVLGFGDFTLKQVSGRHHMDLPFLPCNM
jgi:hypothetical protein